MKKMILLTLAVVMLLAVGCQKKTETTTAETTSPAVDESAPVVTLKVKDMGDIVIQLDPKAAPNTVKNFLDLASSGFYDGLIFHRVIADFMIQGGDPNGDGSGGPGFTIKGEFKSNGVANELKHTRGVISMARTSAPDSAGSQFFIMHGDADYLDGEYAAFGQVVTGMEIVDKIAASPKDALDKPETDVVIEEVIVDAKGLDFSTVERTAE